MACAAHTSPPPISIHALREEGDFTAALSGQKVYKFLSTPSARRATFAAQEQFRHVTNFYPRPPRGGRRRRWRGHLGNNEISIHALREEGDRKSDFYTAPASTFLSTPSARRTPPKRGFFSRPRLISIHALREEGDSALALWPR